MKNFFKNPLLSFQVSSITLDLTLSMMQNRQMCTQFWHVGTTFLVTEMKILGQSKRI